MDQRARLDEIREQWREFGAHVKAGRSVEPSVPLALAYATQVGDLLAIVADLEAANERLVGMALGLQPYLTHLNCDSIASLPDPDCACGLRGRITAIRAASSTGTPAAGEGETDVQ